MSFLSQVTPLVLTWNEEANIARTLSGLSWADDIVVVDSGSSDGTLALLRDQPRARLFTRGFTSHADQWNFGLRETGIASEWVLTLDADYLVDNSFASELQALAPPPEINGYIAPFVYWSLGQRLRGSLYPPRIVLFRKESGAFVQDGHTQRLRLDGRVGHLSRAVHHDDRKDLARWLQSQDSYARLEAQRIAHGQVTWVDRLRRLGVGPPLAALYALVVKRTLLDGPAGWYYALQRGVAEAILALHLWSRR